MHGDQWATCCLDRLREAGYRIRLLLIHCEEAVLATRAQHRRRPLRLTPARNGDTPHDGDGARVAIVNAFTTVNPETEATVRAVDYQMVGAVPDQFRVYSDDERDVVR